MAQVGNAHRRTRRNDRVQGQDGDGGNAADLRATFAHRGVRACLDERALWVAAVPLPRTPESHDGSDVGVLELQPNSLVRSAARATSQSGRGVSQSAE